MILITNYTQIIDLSDNNNNYITLEIFSTILFARAIRYTVNRLIIDFWTQ